MSETHPLRVTITKETYDRVIAEAAADDRKESNMVEVLLKAALDARNAKKAA
jgi:hypothetical protein